MTGEIRAERRVVALNPSRESENRIHADDVARRYGFRGGLVPGVAVYGYLVGLLVDTLGEQWVARGRTSVRFRSPCYEGDELLLRLASDGAVEVSADGTVCVTGETSPGQPDPDRDPDPDPDPDRDPGPDPDGRGARARPPAIPTAVAPDPGARPAVSPQTLAPGTVLGAIPLDTGAGAVDAYGERIGGMPTVLAANRWVHPGMLLDAANRVLMAHVVMPLWLHVGSVIAHERPVTVGEPVEVRARVAREWEQKGHRFVTLDVEWVAAPDGGSPGAGEVVAGATHTAIWHLAGS